MEDKTMIPMIRRKSMLPSLGDGFFGDDTFARFFDVPANTTMPAINIKEGKEEFNIEVAAPGFEKKDFKIDLNNNVLEISSEKEEKNEEDGDKLMRCEFKYASFKRFFTLPDTIESDKIKATYKDGILNVTIPKKEEAKVKPVRQISIS